MKTRGSGGGRKERNRKYYEKICKNERKMEERRRKDRECQKRKKIEESLLYDAQVGGERREKRMRMSEEKLLRELEERRENEILDIGVPQQCEESQEREDVEEEEVEKTSWEEMEEAGEMLMRNGADIPCYMSLDLPAFNALVEECADNLMMTTFKGLPRQKVSSTTRIPGHIFIFMTLFWLRHYPTVDLLSILFRLHVRTCTQVLKRTTVALAKTLKEEVRFPTDEEMEELKHTTMQNHAFSNCVCIVDGSEIQISRPKNKELQRRTWSAKKKQNSLNVMFITKLNGEILSESVLMTNHIGKS